MTPYQPIREVEASWNVMTRAEPRFRLSAKRTIPFNSAGASVQSTTGSRGVRISGSNAGYTTFWGIAKGTGYPFHSPASLHFPSRASPCAITFQLESTAVVQLSVLLSFTYWLLLRHNKGYTDLPTLGHCQLGRTGHRYCDFCNSTNGIKLLNTTSACRRQMDGT